MNKLTARIDIPAKTAISFEGRLYHVDKVRNGRLWIDDEKGKDLRDFDLADIAGLFASGTLKLATASYSNLEPSLELMAREVEIAQLTDDEKTAVTRMLAYIKVLDTAPTGEKSGVALRRATLAKAKELGDDAPPCQRRIYLKRKELIRANGDIRCLVPGQRFRGSRRALLNRTVEDIIDSRIRENYLTPEEISLTQLKALIENDVKVENERRAEENRLAVPHIATIRRRIEKSYDPHVVMTARKGKKAADHHFRMVQGGPICDRPLQLVLIDCYQLDALIVSQFWKKPVRPWLVVILDAYSRCVLGFHLSFDPPSRQTTNQCLRHAFGFKGYLRDKYREVRTDWPCYGIPEAICADNGVEFKNNDILLAMASFNVDIQYSPAGKPYYKGIIERFFLTLNRQLVHMLPGSTRSNPQVLGDYPAEERASVTFEELKEALHQYICDVYHNQPHRSLGATPLDVWMRGCEEHPIAPPPSDEELCVLLGNTETRTVQREGIELFGIVYMEDWLTRLRPIKTGESKKVLVRYDPSSLERIWVLDEDDKKYYPVEAAPKYREYVKHLSEWEHRQVRDEAKAKDAGLDDLKEAERLETLISARAELYTRFATEPPKTAKNARRQRRMIGEGRYADGHGGGGRVEPDARGEGDEPGSRAAEGPASDADVAAAARTVRVESEPRKANRKAGEAKAKGRKSGPASPASPEPAAAAPRRTQNWAQFASTDNGVEFAD